MRDDVTACVLRAQEASLHLHVARLGVTDGCAAEHMLVAVAALDDVVKTLHRVALEEWLR